MPGVTDSLGSVTDPVALARAVDGMDAVVHLAAKVSLAGNPAEFDTVNVGGTRALIAALTESVATPATTPATTPVTTPARTARSRPARATTAGHWT